MDRAHRSLAPKPAEGGRPRPFIVRLHYYQTRELTVKLAAQKAPLLYNGVKVFIFPDLTAEVLTKRREDEVRKRCRASNFLYSFLYPTRFRLTVDGDTPIFDKPEMAENFINQNLHIGSSE